MGGDQLDEGSWWRTSNGQQRVETHSRSREVTYAETLLRLPLRSDTKVQEAIGVSRGSAVSEVL